MSAPTAAQQLDALGNLRAADMDREDMVDAAMFRRRLKMSDAQPLSEKEVERVAAIFKRYFD